MCTISLKKETNTHLYRKSTCKYSGRLLETPLEFLKFAEQANQIISESNQRNLWNQIVIFLHGRLDFLIKAQNVKKWAAFCPSKNTALRYTREHFMTLLLLGTTGSPSTPC